MNEHDIQFWNYNDMFQCFHHSGVVIVCVIKNGFQDSSNSHSSRLESGYWVIIRTVNIYLIRCTIIDKICEFYQLVVS